MEKDEMKDENVWKKQLRIEYKKWYDAETINQELKSIHATQAKLLRLIRRIVSKMEVREDVYFVHHLQPTIERSAVFSSDMLLSLSSSLERLRLEATMEFPALEDNLSVCCRSETKNHEILGSYLETNTITPMACPAKQAADIVWHAIARSEDDSSEKSYTVDVNEGPLRMDGVCIFRQCKEGEQVILLGAMKFCLPNGEILFEAPFWSVISPALSDPSRASVVQSCYKLHTVAPVAGSTLLMDLRTHDVVYTLLGNKMRAIMQMLQNLLLEHVEQGPYQQEIC
ncbi:hypothetical protein PHPALM_29592 [Phytophthora palmivora]|uniref:Uncharacterized protein n=1 Tax=Phytophthora palmivora TaxID=4796 RepID=A0A2P4X761_9STRA|nr:hypothetical protein PHPALM_29592 [Phytophthora palmivora]